MHSTKSYYPDSRHHTASDVLITQNRLSKQWVEIGHSSIQIVPGYELRKGGSY